MPVYQSVSMIFEVICGLTVLGESDRYKTSHLIGIFIGMIIATCGILILGCKKTQVEEEEKKRSLLQHRRAADK